MLHRSGARRPPGDNTSPMAHLVSEILDASLADLMAEARALRRGPARHVLAEGLHPADDALPRRLRLLHVRTAAASRRARVHAARRGARDRASRGRGRAARRRCSRSATSPSCATASRVTSSPRSAARRTIEYLARCAGARARGDGAAAAPEPRRDEPRRARAAAARCRPRWGSCSRRSPTGSARKGGPHWASPDKVPAARLETIRLAGELAIPFTSGILIGIGETREERLEALLALQALGDEHGHLGEVIVQNFRAKPGTRMADHPDAPFEEHLWTVAAARILLGSRLARAGAAESRLRRLSAAPRRGHRRLGRRLAGHDRPRQPGGAVARDRAAARGDRVAGARARPAPAAVPRARRRARPLGRPGRRARRSARLGRASGSRARTVGRRASRSRSRSSSAAMRSRSSSTARSSAGTSSCACSSARGDERERVFAAADRLRREVCGDEVTYVVTRNIQYTNVCYFRCGFCAFSKGKLAENLRGPAYLVPMEEIVRRSVEAWERGGDRGVPPGRHPSLVHGRLLRRRRVLDPGGGAGPARPCVLRARGVAGRRDARPRRSTSTWPACATSGSARCPGPPPRSSTTRCARSSARTRSRPTSGSRCTMPRTASACART